MPGPVVETRYGRIRGTVEGDLAVFRGVPYAAPPVGPLRFAAPQPYDAWEGVRETTSFGPMCPQPPPSLLESVPGDPVEQSEDCLTLNIWTPGLDEGRRPVMVFFHGGGFVGGSSSVGVYDGTGLARHGAVAVTVNYRLGALGWLAHPELAVAGPGGGVGFGNWGLLDQIAALRFVRDNAAAFGGDPGNVTIFGESSGAMCVAALLGASTARPLFRRAVMQSGAAIAIGPAEAQSVTEALATELGFGCVSREALQRVPVADLLAAQGRVGDAKQGDALLFQPVVDGGVLSRHPAAEIAAGAARGIDVMAGTNRDEWAFFTFSAGSKAAIDEARLLELVRSQVELAGLGDSVTAEELIAVHRAARLERGEPVDPSSLYTAIGTDWVFRLPAARLLAAHASYHPGTYAYLFDWETPFAGAALGSCHVLELPFVFDTVRNPFIALFAGSGPEAERLASAMSAAWVAFARNGDPSRGVGVTWPPYSASDRVTMRLGSVIEPVQAPMEVERSWLEDRLGPYGEMESRSLDIVRPLAPRD